MKRALTIVLALMIVMSFSVGVLASGAVPNTVLDATESVVRVLAKYHDGYGTGSGFVIKSDKESTLIATNYHVVEDNPLSVSVWISEEETVTANILAYTNQKDMCILELAYPIDLAALKFADNASQGEAVYAVGFPAAADYLSDTEAHTSAEATITDGIVSAIREATVSGYGTAVKILQINAAINPGNSGGPLFNVAGEVVGINTYGIGESQGIFGAIEISELKGFLADNNIAVSTTPNSPNRTPTILYIFGAVVVVALCVGFIILMKRRQPKMAKKKGSEAISLRKYMENYPEGMGPNNAVAMLLPVALKLRDMHNDGKAHLQVSPDSIYISSYGAELREPTDSEASRYSSGYAAPEIYKGVSAGNLPDIYSFCAILSYVVSGIQPENSLSRAEEIVDSASDFDDILAKGMALSSGDRFETMQELIIKLSPFNLKVFTAECSSATPSTEEAPVKNKKLKIPKFAIAGIAIVVVLGAALGVYFGNYSKAVSYVDAGEYSKAKEHLLAYNLTKILDSELIDYIEAHELLSARKYDDAKSAFLALGEYRDASELVNEADYRHAAQYADANDFQAATEIYNSLGRKGYKDSLDKVNDTYYRLGVYTLYELFNYDEAYTIFTNLSDLGYVKADEMISETIYWQAFDYVDQENYLDAYDKFISIEGYSDVNDIISQLEDVLYLDGQTAYHDEDFDKAVACFSRITPYMNSEDYITLIRASGFNGRLSLLAAGISFEGNIVDKLIDIFYFENASELLVNTNDIACEFLLGNWKSSSGYYFKMEIPSDNKYSYYSWYNLPWYGGSFEIEDGIYYVSSDSYENKPQYKFTLITPDCMEVYCYKGGNTYTLYRD